MFAIVTVAVVVALVVAVTVRLAIRRRDSGRASTVDLGDGGGLGNVPGYMPGMRQEQERHDQASTALVEPPNRGDAAVDLDANTMRVSRPD
jgi:hypothetical protein